MDFDKTSFSVDWFTPGDRCAKRLSFPKSARISLDDLVAESPWSICFGSLDDALSQPPSIPIVPSPPYERPSGRTSNAPPPSPLAPPNSHRAMEDQNVSTPSQDTPDNWRLRASPALVSVVDDCAACGVDMDVSCLDGMDDHLLVSPMSCLIDFCWEAAVHEEVMPVAPVVHTPTRPRARSFKCNYEHALPIFSPKDHSASLERTRPLAAKISLPLEKFPHFLSTPSFEPYDAPSYYSKKPIADVDFLYTDPEGRPLHFPTQGLHTPRRSKKRDYTLTPPSVESFLPPRPSKPSFESSKSSHTLRVFSDAYSSLTRGRRKSPH